MLSIISILFVCLTIALWANIWIYEVCGPDGVLKSLRMWWYKKAFSKMECENLPTKERPFFAKTWKPIFECPLCLSFWLSIGYFTATTLEPFTVIVGCAFSMTFAKIIEKYDFFK